MKKYKNLLCFVLLFTSACSAIEEKSNNDIGVTNEISENSTLNDQDINNQKLIENEPFETINKKEQSKTEVVKHDVQINEESKKEDKPSKPSSIGKDDSSSGKKEEEFETSIKDEIIENAENKSDESSKSETKEANLKESLTESNNKQETKPTCENHKWDDSYGNKPQFSELIFDNWSECDIVMNDIYNNFITEEKPEYEKYYKNSKKQWMSSIAACDVWCECGAHAYTIFITFE